MMLPRGLCRYGSPFDEVRGFTTNGWLSVENSAGDLRDNGKYFRISHAVCAPAAPTDRTP